MSASTLVRDGIESLFVIAVAGMLWSTVGRMRRGEIRVVRCESCGRPTSNAYAACPYCRSPRP